MSDSNLTPAALSLQMAQKHNVDLSKLPKSMEINSNTITANVIQNGMACDDERTKFIYSSLVTHLHDFVRETSLTTDEWMTAINFLTETGQKCSDIRQEFVLLSDTLGVSSLVDSLNNARPSNATTNTVLGPFHTDDANLLPNGASIASEGKGEYMYVHGIVRDTKGNPIAGATLDMWETDGSGQYDTQYDDRDGPDCRGKVVSASDGSYSFRAVLPVAYTIPSDGTVGRFLKTMGRHPWRPAHLHFYITADGYERLITALYFKDDPFLMSDAVFGVRSGLIVETKTITDERVTLQRGFKKAQAHAEVQYDFVLATVEECKEIKKKVMPKVAA